MGFEPQKFFIGLIDFFSILLPGALLTYLCKDWVAVKLGMPGGFPLEDAETGAVFLFASYLLGHFAFLFSAKLDDWLYDPLRNCTDWGQTKRLAEGKILSARWKRRLAKSSYFFDTNADKAVQQAQWIKARALQGLGAAEAINAFQWSKARLTKDHQQGLLAVQRFEADSKFFRSFVVVLGVLTAFYACRGMGLAAVVSFAGIAPALWRYMDQRFKSTQQAYWFVIAMETGAVVTRSPREDGLTHAGGVVYQRQSGVVKFLLVRARDKRVQWVLPKGHIEPGEPSRVTAVREVKEETGHWARVVHWLGDARLGAKTNVRCFLMEFAEEEKTWPEEARQRDWLPLDKAIDRATFRETKSLLEKAAKRVPVR